MATPKHIAFVCLHGSAKSQLAAEYLNRRAAREGIAYRASSAGLEPDAEIPAPVVAGLHAKGIEVAGRTPIHASGAHLATADRVIAFGCDPGAALPPGKPLEQWADCPAVSDGFEPAWQYITRRVDSLLAEK